MAQMIVNDKNRSVEEKKEKTLRERSRSLPSIALDIAVSIIYLIDQLSDFLCIYHLVLLESLQLIVL